MTQNVPVVYQKDVTYILHYKWGHFLKSKWTHCALKKKYKLSLHFQLSQSQWALETFKKNVLLTVVAVKSCPRSKLYKNQVLQKKARYDSMERLVMKDASYIWDADIKHHADKNTGL